MPAGNTQERGLGFRCDCRCVEAVGGGVRHTESELEDEIGRKG